MLRKQYTGCRTPLGAIWDAASNLENLLGKLTGETAIGKDRKDDQRIFAKMVRNEKKVEFLPSSSTC